MAVIRLTAGDDLYVQAVANAALRDDIYGEDGNDTIRIYHGTVVGGRGNDRIELIFDPANPWRSISVAYWDSPTGVEVNLVEGWASDGFGGRDTLVGVSAVHGNRGDDRFIGDDANNVLAANHGHDYFDGGGGYDSAHTWFNPDGESAGRIARLDELVIRVSVDGKTAKVTTKVGTGFSLDLVNVEALNVFDATGQRVDVLLANFITPQVMAEDAIAAGNAMRWNAAQPLGTATALTFSFVTQGTQAGFRAFTPAEQQAVREILAYTAQLCGLTFSEVAEGSGTAGQLRFGISQQAASKGTAALPGTQGDLAGDVWMDVESMVTVVAGSEGHAALLHEIGHALGLRHPRNIDPGESWAMQLREADDRPGLTAMSSQMSADGLFRADWGVLDIIALRYLYGTRAVNEGNDVHVIGAAQSLSAHTLVDDGGHDVIDASGVASGVRLDLVPGHLGSAGITSAGFAGVENLGLADGSWIEDAIGSRFDDVLFGNDGPNVLTGGLGNDRIDGGGGVDSAVFAGPRSAYLLSNAFGKLQVEARDGVGGFDIVSGIEQLVFADQSVALTASALGADTEFSVDEDSRITLTLPDPSDAQRSSVSYRLVAQPRHGSAQLSADGQLSYAPHADYNGSDVISFELFSGAASNRYQAFIDVRRVNDGPPVAEDVTLLVPGGATLRGTLPAAIDADADPVAYAVTAAAKQGDVVVSADGSFRYTPKADYVGTDQFGFIVGDGVGGTNNYTASVLVLPVASTREGSAGGETLDGSAAAEGFLALAGNDRITGRGGNDVIDGGAGIDTAIYTKGRSEYVLSGVAFGWTVQDKAGGEGTDNLAGIERLKFSNASLALDLDGNAGTVAQVIRALFGSSALANTGYVGIGLKLVDAGMGYAELVRLAVGTQIFEQLAGGRSNTAFVNLVYKNVIGSAPGAGELATYVGLLDAGVYTQETLALAACQISFNTASVEIMGLTSTGIEFIAQG